MFAAFGEPVIKAGALKYARREIASSRGGRSIFNEESREILR
jgi:hypothetical protein